MRERLGEALFPFLAREGLTLDDFDGFLLHPGGSKVLDDRGGRARAVARPAALLLGGAEKVRQHVLGDGAVRAQGGASPTGARGRFLLAAFGPGFSGYFVVLEL